MAKDNLKDQVSIDEPVENIEPVQEVKNKKQENAKTSQKPITVDGYKIEMLQSKKFFYNKVVYDWKKGEKKTVNKQLKDILLGQPNVARLIM